MQIEPFHLSLQGTMDRWLRLPEQNLEVTGTVSPLALASLMLSPGCQASGLPQLAVVSSQEQTSLLRQALTFLDPSVVIYELPAFDVGVYSNLYPSRRLIAERVNWLYQAQNARSGQIFIAPIEALLQRTMPYEVLHQGQHKYKVRDDIPADLPEILSTLGYTAVPMVEDVGTYALRGGILDVFSPAHAQPVRLELFGHTIDSLRFFDPETQRSTNPSSCLELVPAHEVLFTPDRRQRAAQMLKASTQGRELDTHEVQSALHGIAHGQYLHGLEFLVSYFYPMPALPLDHFSAPLLVWHLDPVEISRSYDHFHGDLKNEYETSDSILIRPHFTEVFASLDQLQPPEGGRSIHLSRIHIADHAEPVVGEQISFSTSELKEFTGAAKALATHSHEFSSFLASKLDDWRSSGQRVFFTAATLSQSQRLRLILERAGFESHLAGEDDAAWDSWLQEQNANSRLIHVIPRRLPESIRFSNDQIILIRDEDLFGRKAIRRERIKETSPEIHTEALSFSDLRVGDLVVHTLHGVGIYEGLKVMPIQGVPAELIQIKYKDNDRLYLPIFRIGQINKFSGPTTTHALDKLGGTSWEKAKTKVRNHLRDVASELLQLYANRAQLHRPSYSPPDDDFASFEASFPYEETPDQLRSIQDVLGDLNGDKPMDRLICGDVGFGKTEVALRAAFKVASEHRQVAVITPTTVLSFQHTETFKRRFKDWPINIRSLHRFVPKNEVSETLKGLKDGSVDIVIGTHRLLSRDIDFKNLGLLIIDEEQKFGVQHKERIRKIKNGVDTLTMSATPIPRTLNMSLMGLRDLSIINTAPADRLPTRTFVCKYDHDTIRKAVTSEVARGGQVFFIHNRIESIYALLDDLRSFLPEVRMGLAHGQMEEGELERVMVAFFNQEIDMLVCTTIVESGMDIPKANTMFIDNAHQLGLSQLYQLRGRVGRSKERAYCYLLVPANRRIDADAQERLKVLQENTALGSGIRIAQYDLELRGSGDLLGEEQSGHINAVGYEMYLELLDEAIKEVKGVPGEEGHVEPDINVRIPALIPDSYIPDIRIRLSYYKLFSDIRSPEDMEQHERDLHDQFGTPPEPVINLMGLMLVRSLCKDLSVKDLSSGKLGVSLLFTDRTPLPTERVLELAQRQNKKFNITPDSRLHIRMSEVSWTRLYDELLYLRSLCPGSKFS